MAEKSLEERVKELEAKVLALEMRPPVVYQFPSQPGYPWYHYQYPPYGGGGGGSGDPMPPMTPVWCQGTISGPGVSHIQS